MSGPIFLILLENLCFSLKLGDPKEEDENIDEDLDRQGMVATETCYANQSCQGYVLLVGKLIYILKVVEINERPKSYTKDFYLRFYDLMSVRW